LQLAADQARENEALQLVIQTQAPKVEALDRLTNTTGSICITDAAKHMGVPPLQLFGWLSKNRWIYRRSSFANWSAFQPRISAGVLEHKLVQLRNKETQELKVVEQVMVTRRGLVLLAEKLTGAAL
jgi:phage antirepressor YoqD-like protein